MPEAFTYFDMQRRLAVAFPSHENFTLRVFEENGRHSGTGDAASLTELAKQKARKADRSKFKPNAERSFPGLENLPLRLRNGSQSFSLCGDHIESRRKALGIPITEDWFMNIQILMHGHVIAISFKQLNYLLEARREFVASGGLDTIGREHEDGAVTIQLALLNTNPDGNCIIVVDRIRLDIITFLEVSPPSFAWWSKKQGPCPITDPEQWSSKFDLFLTSRQDFFNGIGTSNANEILHLAWEHPTQKASVIFGTPARRERVKATILQFFAFAHSNRYQKAVPSGRSGGSAFAEPAYITRNIISLQQRVYGHTASPTKISKEHYADLFNRGLLDESTQKAKKVDIYAIRFLLATTSTADDSDASDPDDPDAPATPKKFKAGY